MATKPKVALCFFGLVKNYNLTAASVEQYVLAPLRKQGYDYDVYVHTYQQRLTSNPRNAESNAVVHPHSILKSFPKAVIKKEPPEVADRQRPLTWYLQNGDPWPDNPRISMQNYVRQLYSLRQVTTLWWPKAQQYVYVIYLRPDVRFTTPLTLNPGLKASQVVIPSFHNFNGCNDRFAYGRPVTMKLYGERWSWLPTYFSKHKAPLHAERYLALYLQAYGLEVVRIPLHFIRVRANGQENPSDRAAQTPSSQVPSRVPVRKRK